MVDRQLLNKVSDELKQRHLTIATAESCTGGLIAHTLTNVTGSSEYFERGIVSYSNTSKKELLNVPETILQQYGAVSQHTAEAMAQGIKKQAKVDFGLATTGIAGPTGGTKDKPVGLVYISIATPQKVLVKKYQFTGDRLSIKEQTCTAALTFLLETLQDFKG